MKILQSRLFAKKVKKLSKSEKAILDSEIRKIIDHPEIGQEKKGDLKGIFVHKFKFRTNQFLLAYRLNHENIEFIILGFHENYYRDLKKYL